MIINTQYAWQSGSNSNSRENSPLLPRNVRGLVIGKSGCGKTTVIFNLLLQPNWLDYNHLYVFGKSLHQPEYKVLRKGFEAGLSKQQITNVFANQEALHAANVSPLTTIDIPDQSAKEPAKEPAAVGRLLPREGEYSRCVLHSR